MPLKDQTSPTSRSTRIREWLAANPGAHRPRDIANGLGLPPGTSQQDWSRMVASDAGRLWRSGHLDKVMRVVEGWKVPQALYSLPPQPAETCDA